MKSHAVFGPPGTGKTQKLSKYVDAAGPGKIAAMSFSRSAAHELSARTTADYVGTIHALAYRALEAQKGQIAHNKDFFKYIGGDVDVCDLALHLGGLSRRTGSTLYDVYTASVGLPPFYLVEFYWDAYVQWKRAYALWDFDDLLEKAMGRTETYDTVVVDEAQDMSRQQWEFILSLVNPTGRLIVAGDDDQCIYTWAGAWPHGMVALAADSKEVLNQSYRVPRAVFECAHRTVKQITRREPKIYVPRADSGYVHRADTYNPDVLPNGHMVLCRDRFVMKEVERDLQLNGIPYRAVGAHGRGLFEGPEAAVLRAMHAGNLDYLKNRADKLTYKARQTVAAGRIPTDMLASLAAPKETTDYLARIDLDDEPLITVSTIHAQKGREADHVVIIQDCAPLVDSAYAENESFENEVRVWYVAITRARKGVTFVGHNAYTLQ